MKVAGIIAEFNPFHNGHKYLIESIKKSCDAVVVVLSGNFVQRGDVALFDKATRTKSALLNGADLVIELPIGWSMSGAENFAFGGISLLKSTGIITDVFCGSENNDVNILNLVADYLLSDEFKSDFKNCKKNGQGFAKTRENLVVQKFSKANGILAKPNNTLAIEYLKAIKALSFNVGFSTITRIGPEHDSNNSLNGMCSASYLRSLIKSDSPIYEFIPKNLTQLYSQAEPADIKNLEQAFLFMLRKCDDNIFKSLPDVSEGIENRINKAIKVAKTFDEVISICKTKRYTDARIRRILISACVGLDNSYIKKEPPYIKVLGFNNIGENLLKEIAKKSSKPIIVKYKDLENLNDFSKKVFEAESKAADLYQLSFKDPNPCGSEKAYFPIKL